MSKSNGRGGNPTKTDKRKPSASKDTDSPQFTTLQLEAIELLASKPRTTQDKAAKELGIDRTTLWKYRKMDGFVDAVTKRAQEIFTHDIPAWFAAASDRAKAGDVQALRMCFQAVGVIDNDTLKVAIEPVVIIRPEYKDAPSKNGDDPERNRIKDELNRGRRGSGQL